MPRVAVLCWEESRPWVSALRQKGFSVPWVDEPRAEVQRMPAVEPDLLLVDLTRMPDVGKGSIESLAAQGLLEGVPVVLVSSTDDVSDGLRGKVDALTVTSPTKIISAVRSALSGR
jgi:DNA-binding response OmpR family regulator